MDFNDLKTCAESQNIFINVENNSSQLISLTKANKKIVCSLNQYIYLSDLIYSFDYFVEPFFADEIESYGDKEVTIMDFSKPRIHTLKSGISFYFSSITEGPEVFDWYFYWNKPQEGDIVFDCGAYCGVITYLLSKAVGETGRVYSFEPDNLNYSMLCKNIKMHNLKNVVPIKKGIWSETTTLEFSSESNLGSALSSIVGRKINPILIDCVSLSDVCQEYSIDKLDYVKMDIEGAEIQAIEGARDFIQKQHINFAIASYHNVPGVCKHTYEILEKIFPELDYECLTGNPSGGREHGSLVTWASKK